MAEAFIGEIRMFGGNFAPRNWAFCNGQLMPISQNSALFSLLGTFYGGDGRSTFALPDLQGRVPLGFGHGNGLSAHTLGQKGGEQAVTLTVAQMPGHGHGTSTTTHCVTGGGNNNVAAGNFWSKDAGTQAATYHAGPADGVMATDAVTTALEKTGGSQPHDNMQPYLAINFIICLFGLFPSRN